MVDLSYGFFKGGGALIGSIFIVFLFEMFPEYDFYYGIIFGGGLYIFSLTFFYVLFSKYFYLTNVVDELLLKVKLKVI
jgi:hypothetical protein